MSNQSGKNGLVVVLIAVIALIVVVATGMVVAYISSANSAARSESSIEALNSESENVLSTTTINIKNQTGIVGVYSKDFQDSLTKAMSGRYGQQGSQAMFQMIKEQNPALDSSLYAKIQAIIDGGAKEFRISQTRKLEVCRDYKASLNYVVGGAIKRMAGYPKINLATECRIVSDSDSQEAFQTGLQKPIDFKH